MLEYDIIIVGAGVTGLWLAGRLRREGYNLIVVENGEVGADAFFNDGSGDAKMAERWEACFEGWGDLDLAAVETCGGGRFLWPADTAVSGLVVAAAARAASAGAQKLKPGDLPEALSHLGSDKNLKNRVYALPVRTPDPASLIAALTAGLQGRLLKGEVQELLPDGQIAVSGTALRAQLVIFTGADSSRALKLMRVRENPAPSVPLRRIAVKPVTAAFHGTAVTADLAARVTISSRPLDGGGHVWHLGGNLATEAAKLDRPAAFTFAKREMEDLFPQLDWAGRAWAATDHAGPGPHKGAQVHQRGRVLIVTESRADFAPAVCDRVHAWMRNKDIAPKAKTPPPPLPQADPAHTPDDAAWEALA